MTKRDLSVIKGFIQDSIKETVNGKIDKLSSDFQTYKAEDEKWKREVSPAIQNMQNLTISAKTLLWIIVGIGGLAAFFANIGAIIHAVKY